MYLNLEQIKDLEKINIHRIKENFQQHVYKELNRILKEMTTKPLD